MKTTNHNQPIDPLIARSHRIINEQIKADASEASDEAWKDPKKIMEVGVDELTAHRIAQKLSSGLSLDRPGNITQMSEIIRPEEEMEIHRLEVLAKEAADQSKLLKGYEPVGLNGQPFTREQLHNEITGEKPVTSNRANARVYDQEQEADQQKTEAA